MKVGAPLAGALRAENEQSNMNKIKVVHLITKLELGGAQVNTIYTYENLDQSQFETYLISGPGGILTDKVEKKENFIIIDSLVREINPLKDFKTLRQLMKLLKKIRPQVIHTHSSKAGILGRVAARLTRVPAIIHSVHGFPFSPFQSFLKRTFFTTAEKIVSRITRHFVFVSNDDIQIARQKKLVRDNYSLIRSGFPFKKFLQNTPDPLIQRKRFNIKEDDFVCGVIAPFKPQKGLFHLVEIAARVLEPGKTDKNIIFLICGDGDLRPAIEEKLKEKNILQYFRLPGFLFDVEKAVHIFDLGVSTALWEGLPQSLVQLRIKKKAAVVSDINGNREVIQNDKNGFLVPVTDYDTFAAKILRLIDDDPLREQLARFGDDYSPWDADNMVREQEKLYHRLVQDFSS